MYLSSNHIEHGNRDYQQEHISDFFGQVVFVYRLKYIEVMLSPVLNIPFKPLITITVVVFAHYKVDRLAVYLIAMSISWQSLVKSVSVKGL